MYLPHKVTIQQVVTNISIISPIPCHIYPIERHPSLHAMSVDAPRPHELLCALKYQTYFAPGNWVNFGTRWFLIKGIPYIYDAGGPAKAADHVGVPLEELKPLTVVVVQTGGHTDDGQGGWVDAPTAVTQPSAVLRGGVLYGVLRRNAAHQVDPLLAQQNRPETWWDLQLPVGTIINSTNTVLINGVSYSVEGTDAGQSEPVCLIARLSKVG